MSPSPAMQQAREVIARPKSSKMNLRLDQSIRDVPFKLGSHAQWQMSLNALSRSLAEEDMPDEFSFEGMDSARYTYDFSVERSVTRLYNSGR